MLGLGPCTIWLPHQNVVIDASAEHLRIEKLLDVETLPRMEIDDDEVIRVLP
jgi:hypothetical protein